MSVKKRLPKTNWGIVKILLVEDVQILLNFQLLPVCYPLNIKIHKGTISQLLDPPLYEANDFELR